MGLIEIALTALYLNATCVEVGKNVDYYEDGRPVFDFEITTNVTYMEEESANTTFLENGANATCSRGDYDERSAKKKRLAEQTREIESENLIVTTLENNRLSGVEKINGTFFGTGVAFDLLNILQKKFHFNYTILPPKKNVYGTAKSGILEMLKTRKADLSAAFLPVLSSYSTEISYSPSMDTGEWVVLMRRPEASATGSGLLAPFTLPVWLLILLSLVVVGPVIHLIIYLQAKMCKDDQNRIFPLPACIWFVYGALLKQGTTLNPMTDSSRILFSTWWIFITILTAFYTANLTAFLTLSKFTLPITEPKDIGAKKYHWVSNEGNALQDTVRYSDGRVSELGQLLGNKYKFSENSDSEILNYYVGQKDYMFIREKPIVDYVMYDDYKEKTRKGEEEQKRCTYVVTKFSVASFSRAFAYSKRFKYKELFDSAIQYLVESGIIKFKLREQLPDTEICPHNLGSKERQLLNSDLLMTYEIVGGGFIISAIIFIVELLLHRYKNKTKIPVSSKTSLKDILLHNPPKHTFHVNINNNYEKMGSLPYSNKFITPPPPYHTLFNPPGKNENVKKKNINGREYWVCDSLAGETTMIPMRTPSALLFQYNH